MASGGQFMGSGHRARAGTEWLSTCAGCALHKDVLTTISQSHHAHGKFVCYDSLLTEPQHPEKKEL